MDARVRTHLLRQAGVISRAQALTSGLTSRQVGGLLQRGDWLREWPGVYRLHATAPTPETGLWAALLWLGGDALLADRGALWWWGLTADPPTTWAFVTPLHRVSDGKVRLLDVFVDPAERDRHRGIAVLSVPLTVLRAAVEAEEERPGAGIALIDRAKQQRKVTAADLERALDRHPGTWGYRTARRLLERTGDRAHSELERMAVALLRSAGLTGFEVNLSVRLASGRRVELDVAFPERRVVIELDGYAYHSSPEAHRTDLQRANELMAEGWTVRRFTYSDLLADPEGFVETVHELLRG